jgi:hypothetical protein
MDHLDRLQPGVFHPVEQSLARDRADEPAGHGPACLTILAIMVIVLL